MRSTDLRADFSKYAFKADQSFEGFVFPGDANFSHATFAGRAAFKDATFHGLANFTHATIQLVADFRDTRFECDARFDGAILRSGPLTLRGATFNGDASFQAIVGAVPLMLSRTAFSRLPDFRFSDFRSPQMDNVKVGRGLVRRWNDTLHTDPRARLLRWALVATHPDNAAKLRVLKGFSIEDHDHEREHEFFSLEVISRRYWQDQPCGKGFARFWLGHLYGTFSDFGRSFARPAIALLALWVFFAWFYWEQQSPWSRGLTLKQDVVTISNLTPGGNRVAGWLSRYYRTPSELCSQGEGPASSHAWFLSTKNMLVGLGGAREEETIQAYRCLYGAQLDTTLIAHPKRRDEPIIPAAVTYASYLQNVLSVVCFWFMGLAAKNMFRQK